MSRQGRAPTPGMGSQPRADTRPQDVWGLCIGSLGDAEVLKMVGPLRRFSYMYTRVF